MTSEFCLKTGDESGNFLAGMIFGEKQSIDPDIKNSLYRVGIGHILSVSGLHVSIIALAFMAVFSLLRINKYVSFGLTNVLMAMLVTHGKFTDISDTSRYNDGFYLLCETFSQAE